MLCYALKLKNLKKNLTSNRLSGGRMTQEHKRHASRSTHAATHCLKSSGVTYPPTPTSSVFISVFSK